MTGMAYLRPDDGVADAAEMVEVKPHVFVRRDAAIAMGLWGSRAPDRDGRAEIRVEAAEPHRAHEMAALPADPGHLEPAMPPEPGVEAPAAPSSRRRSRPGKVKRSLAEILADCRS